MQSLSFFRPFVVFSFFPSASCFLRLLSVSLLYLTWCSSFILIGIGWLVDSLHPMPLAYVPLSSHLRATPLTPETLPLCFAFFVLFFNWIADPKLRQDTEDLQIRTVSGGFGPSFLLFSFLFVVERWNWFAAFAGLGRKWNWKILKLELFWKYWLGCFCFTGAIISIVAGFIIVLLTVAQISAYMTADIVQVQLES